jgi:hypothetical protein
VNFSLALAETPREILIDGTSYVLVRKAALDALFSNGAAGDRNAPSPAVRVASPHTSRPAPKKLKAPPARLPVVARAAAAPKPEVPVNGGLRAAVLAAIQQSHGQTSLEIFDAIRQKIPTTTSGSVYQAIKSWVKKRVVEGKQTDEGTIGWHPRSARKAAGNTGTPKASTPLPNAAAIHPAPSGSAEARGAV